MSEPMHIHDEIKHAVHIFSKIEDRRLELKANKNRRLQKYEKIVEAIQEEKGVVSRIAKRLKINRKSVYDYLADYPELTQLKEEAREVLVDEAEIALADLLKDKDFRAIRYVLLVFGKHRGHVMPKDGETVNNPMELNVSFTDHNTGKSHSFPSPRNESYREAKEKTSKKKTSKKKTSK